VGEWYLGNRPILALPVLGGGGRMMFTLFGALLLVGSLTVVMRHLVIRKKTVKLKSIKI